MWGNPTILDLLKKYWEKIIKNLSRKVNIDAINWEELFDRFADHKYCNIPSLINFKHVKGHQKLVVLNIEFSFSHNTCVKSF